jgi:hypothetical protein
MSDLNRAIDWNSLQSPSRPWMSWIFAFALAVILSSSSIGMEKEKEWQKWRESFDEKILPIIQSKCLKCHEGENPEGEFDLSKYTNGQAAVEGGDIWERVAVRVRLNEMPPPKSPGLTDPEKGAFHRWVDTRPDQDLCNKLASDETQAWYRGHVMSRRLTRTEYANAIRDLTGQPLPDELLPPEDGGGGEGFDTVGDSLFTSPIHLEAYLRATEFAIDRVFSSKQIVEVASHFQTVTGTPILSLPQDDSLGAQRIAADRSLRQFARLAWRRPIVDADIEKLMGLYATSGGDSGRHLQGIQQAFKAILLSPQFLFVNEPEPEASGVQRLTPHQFAMRMGLVVWSSIPDATLLQLADENRLFDPEMIRGQLNRMLLDDRARSLGENFGMQWLGLRDLMQIKPDAEVYPQYDEDLSKAAREEVVRFVSGVFREGRPLTDLLDSDYLVLNERLANHYGLPWSGGEDWARVDLPADGKHRGGVTTMAGVLIKTSYPRRTSPVLRGRWILEDVLGAKVPPPPPNVPALEENDHGPNNLTLRQRLEKHRENPECASCHDRMDPLGFGLENFDAIGRWRTEDNGQKVDSEGKLPSGETFLGSAGLKKVLLDRKDEFYRHVSRKMVGFALGRELSKFDQCVIDKSVERLHKEARASVILEEIFLSYAFQHRYYSNSNK